MKIRITEPNQTDADGNPQPALKLNIGGKLQPFYNGDEVTVDAAVGTVACAHGWAEDIDGQVATGERKPGASGPVEPTPVKQTVRGG